jgi:multidrug efflux pump subunit AcrA (membrane-fusion protein)
VNGRVVAAFSPTLYAKAASTVNLKVAAGDTVKKGQVLAVLESPDLMDALKHEISTCEQLKAEVARQRILAENRSCSRSAKPTRPKSSACPPGGRWSATNPWRSSA